MSATKLGFVFETTEHKIKKIQYTTYVRSGRGVRAKNAIGYVIYNSDGSLTEKDAKNYIIDGYKYSTKKAAVEVITALEV